MTDGSDQGPRPRNLRAIEEPPQEPTHVPIDDPLQIQAVRLFAAREHEHFRYDHSSGRWLEWTGLRWQIDEVEAARWRMIQIVDDMRLVDPANRRSLGNLSFAEKAFSAVRADPRIAATHKVFDSDPLLVGTPTGYIDLRTGEHHKPDHRKMISKCLGVSPADEANCPMWLKFLGEATEGKYGLLDYLQKFFGYCLSGLMNEEIMTFVYGPGGNGKGVMLKTIGSIFGDYYISTPASTFMETKGNEHPTELARLNGRRFVSASETTDDAKWNLARIKEITGNENPISARYMRQDYFEFWAVSKLAIIGNSKPQIGEVDPAIARRLRLIEMVNRPKLVDKGLKERLEPERASILRWMVDGWQRYREEGLEPPECVKSASSAYLAAEDVATQFLDECTEETASGVLLRRDIGRAMQLFLKANGHGKKIPATKVYKKLVEERGFMDGETFQKNRCFKGIRLNEYAWGLIRDDAKSAGVEEPKVQFPYGEPGW